MFKIISVLAGAALLCSCGGNGGGFNPYVYRYPDPSPYVGLGNYGPFSIVPTGIAGYGRVVGNDGYRSGKYLIGSEALDQEVCARYDYCSGINPHRLRYRTYSRRHY